MKVTLQDILSHYGVELARRTSTGGVVFCPFHEDGKKPACSVNFQKNMFHCFSCGAGGGTVKFVQLKENVSREEAYEVLRRKFGVPFHKNYQINADPQKELEQLNKLHFERLKIGMKFCENQGIDLLNLKKKDEGSWLGLLGWCISKEAIASAEKLKMYYESEEGKKDLMISSLVGRCFEEWNLLKKFTKSVEYSGKETMLSELEKQIDIRCDKMFFTRRKGTDEQFESLRENFLEFYVVLKKMVLKKSAWIKMLPEIDWMLP